MKKLMKRESYRCKQEGLYQNTGFIGLDADIGL